MSSIGELQSLLIMHTEELTKRDRKIGDLERELDRKDVTIRHLRNELDKFRQVVRPLTQQMMNAKPARTKRQAISAEPTEATLDEDGRLADAAFNIVKVAKPGE